MNLLLLIILFPLLCTLVALMKGSKVSKWAFAASLVPLGLTLAALNSFVADASTQFLVDLPWIPSLGIHFKLGIDGISMMMVLLTNLLIPIIILASAKHEYKKSQCFFTA